MDQPRCSNLISRLISLLSTVDAADAHSCSDSVEITSRTQEIALCQASKRHSTLLFKRSMKNLISVRMTRGGSDWKAKYLSCRPNLG